MASVKELKVESRLGGTRGQHGAQGHGRSFHVVTDSVNDDPGAVIQTTPTDYNETIVIGSPHPWGAYGVVVTDLREAERMTDTDWIIDAIYGTPLVLDPTLPWDIDLDVSLETFTRYRDLDNQVVGPAVYHPVPSEEEFPGVRRTNEITRLNTQRSFDTTAIFHAPTSDNGRQPLYAAKSGARRAVGLPCTRKVSGMSLSRNIPNLQAVQIGTAQGMVNTVNRSSFFGANRGTAKFIGMRSRSVNRVVTGQTVISRSFDVQLMFLIDSEGHNPQNEYDLYEHRDGTKGIIEDPAGRAVRRKYRFYPEIDYSTVLVTLETGAMVGASSSTITGGTGRG